MVYLAADDLLANFAIESLKQLKDTSGGNVVVAAQMGFEDEKRASCRGYIFGNQGISKEAMAATSINDPGFKPDRQPADDADMTDPDTLTEFINWAYANRGDASQYCLVLWGHGPELLHEAPVRLHNLHVAPTGKRRGTYFTPVELKDAIKKTQLKKNRPNAAFEIIAMDACSMSMFEYAYELKDFAEYMLASQEEVSDLSFPYDTLLGLFRTPGQDVKALCQKCVAGYVKEYQDYLVDLQTGMNPPTLSALHLTKQDTVTVPFCDFVQELRRAAQTPDGRKAILEARTKSQGFVGGLFVDLHDFCDKLASPESGAEESLRQACKSLSGAININGKQDDFIIKNQVGKNQVGEEKLPHFDGDSCHGLSIYFPYLRTEEKHRIEEFKLIKGVGNSGSDGSKDAVNEIASRIQHDVRRRVIQDTEEYYSKPAFTFARQTHWYDFIQCDWSRILAEHRRRELDLTYSGQQCADNLLKASKLTCAKQEEQQEESLATK